MNHERVEMRSLLIAGVAVLLTFGSVGVSSGLGNGVEPAAAGQEAVGQESADQEVAEQEAADQESAAQESETSEIGRRGGPGCCARGAAAAEGRGCWRAGEAADGSGCRRSGAAAEGSGCRRSGEGGCCGSMGRHSGPGAGGGRMGRGPGHGRSGFGPGHGRAGGGPGQGAADRGMGHGGGPAVMQTARALVHDYREAIERQVEEIENGVVTVTRAPSSPEAAEAIARHVSEMKQLLASGGRVRMWDPLFRELFDRADEISLEIEQLEDGMRVTETSDDPAVVKLIQAHARKVSEFVERGPAAVHEETPLPAGYDPAS